jgi:hypothetical protein
MAPSNMTYPRTKMTNKFLSGKLSLNLLLAFKISLMSNTRNTVSQIDANAMIIVETQIHSEPFILWESKVG